MYKKAMILSQLANVLPKSMLYMMQLIERQWEVAVKAGDDPAKIKQMQERLEMFAKNRAELPRWLHHPPKIKGDFYLLSSIWADGAGDFYALLQAARVIQEGLPGLTVYAACQHKRPLPPIDLAHYHLDAKRFETFQETDTDISHVLEPVLMEQKPVFEERLAFLQQEIAKDQAAIRKNPAAAEILQEAIEEAKQEVARLSIYAEQKVKALALRKRLEKACGILNISLALDTFTAQDLREKSMYFAESGNFQGIENALKLNWYSMGLGPFDDGLFLYGSKQPTAGHYAGYFHHESRPQSAFIHLIALLHKSKEPAVIYIPLKSLHVLELGAEFLKKAGVHRIRFQGEELIFATHGKTLEIRNPFPLPRQDFSLLLASAKSPVGCTGDGSLGDCLASHQLPFYEMRPHKRELWEGLFQQTRIHAPELSTYMEGFESLLKAGTDPVKFAEETCRALSESGDFLEHFEKVVQEVHTYYKFQDNLLARVNQFLSKRS